MFEILWLWSLFGPFEFPRFILFAELSTRVLLPYLYQSAAPPFAYYSPVRTIPELPTHVLFYSPVPIPSSPFPYHSPARTSPHQLSILSRNLPWTQYSSQELPEAQDLVIVPTQLGSLEYLSNSPRYLATAHPDAHLLLIQVLTHCSPGTHALLSLLIWELHYSLCG